MRGADWPGPGMGGSPHWHGWRCRIVKVQLRDIHKHFGPVRANDGCSVTIRSGTIHGLLGENGAGKTTLMKVLSGFISADSGTILLDGQSPPLRTPAEAITAGVGMLHQDPLDFPPLCVLDDFLLGPGGGLFPDRAKARRALAEMGRQFGFELDPSAAVSALTVGERQQLELLRLLSLGVQVLILDEPTTGITADQKVSLFAALRVLASKGRTVIFVSHKLEDVQTLCHEVTVLRQGKVAGQCTIPCSNELLVQTMFGQSLVTPPRAAIEPGEPALELANLGVSVGRVRVSGLNLQVRRGEVIGLAGLEGSGQGLVLRACAGLVALSAGKVRLGGTDLTGQAYERFLAAGVAFLPAGRLEEGLIPGLSVCEHIALADRGGGFFLDWRAAKERAVECIAAFNIHGRPDSLVEGLSGGNQQRTLLALLPPDLNLLLMEHPTRGLDIESTMWVWERLTERRRQGTAILFMSADLDEIIEHSDRILVFSGGQVTRALLAAETTAGQLGEYIGGLAEAGRPRLG
jgi:ABC-type uncharacterized transport system ATPase subunit